MNAMTADPPSRSRFRLLVEADATMAIHRLRALLKVLGRQHDITVLDAVEERPALDVEDDFSPPSQA